MPRSRANDPLQQYRFKVEMANGEMGFSRVSGLEMEIESVEYKEGNEVVVKKIPGRKSGGTATFERGASNDTTIFDLFEAVTDPTIDNPRLSVTVTELNYAGEVVKSYTLKNAWVSRVNAPEFDASSSEVAVESMEMEYEDMKIRDLSG